MNSTITHAAEAECWGYACFNVYTQMIMISITMKVIVADVRHLKLHNDYTNKAAGEL